MRRGTDGRLVLALLVLVLLLASACRPAGEGKDAKAEPEPPALATLRLDLRHSGGPSGERLEVEGLVHEPLPWPGNPARPLDATGLGAYRFEVRAAAGKVVYSRGFSSVYGEWETTAEASTTDRTLTESLRFPWAADAGPGPVEVVVEKRGATDGLFREVLRTRVDVGTAVAVDSAQAPPLLELERHGDPATHLDLLLLGDGYTAAERERFETDARRLLDALFAHSPFRERRNDLNVWGLVPEAAESGISRPSSGIVRANPVGSTYDAFGSERYILTFDDRAFRGAAAWAPYDVVTILVNSEVYGGGGIFGQYSTVAASNPDADYVFIHELAHHLAALADEYYTSAVAYETPPVTLEPWEKNVTALLDGRLKWADLATPGVAVPTPWPKAKYEEMAAGIQARRRKLREERRPESEMTALFAEQRGLETALFQGAEHRDAVAAFEGASYQAKGLYRPQLDCVMFSRNPVSFCSVCRRSLDEVIDLYTRGLTALAGP